MAFCRPSGEICSSSATTRISWALTTDATSWPSAWNAKSSKIFNYIENNYTLSKEKFFTLFIILPHVSESRHFPCAVWRTRLERWLTDLQKWSRGSPWQWSDAGNPQRHSFLVSHNPLPVGRQTVAGHHNKHWLHGVLKRAGSGGQDVLGPSTWLR